MQFKVAAKQKSEHGSSLCKVFQSCMTRIGPFRNGGCTRYLAGGGDIACRLCPKPRQPEQQ
jgi:hypothetical protein